jgi:hypothetical protein
VLADANMYGTGEFIPVNNTLATTASLQIPVNDDFTVAQNQIYGIPIDTIKNRIYNITLKLIGNYSDITSLNATIDAIRIHSGNLYNTTIPTMLTIIQDNESSMIQAAFMALHTASYLFVDITRNGAGLYYNATLQLQLFLQDPALLNIFNVNSDYIWNETILPDEVPDSQPLWKILTSGSILPPSVKVDDLVPLLLLGAAGTGIIGVGGFVLYRVSKSKGIIGKRP